jgi:hypothetical protein
LPVAGLAALASTPAGICRRAWSTGWLKLTLESSVSCTILPFSSYLRFIGTLTPPMSRQSE